jgi:hypothetical protein
MESGPTLNFITHLFVATCTCHYVVTKILFPHAQSEVWIQDGKEKLKLMEEYKTNLGYDVASFIIFPHTNND